MDPQTSEASVQQSNIPPVEDVSTSKSKLPIIIGGIILLILVGVGSYYFGQRSVTQVTQQVLPTNIPSNIPSPTPASNAADADPTTEIQKLENPNNDPNIMVTINKTYGNFSIGTITAKNGGGAAYLWIKKNNQWTRLQVTQFAWSCKKLLDNKVPVELDINECIFYENEGDCIGYEKECVEQRQNNNQSFEYQELYRTKFGL